MGIKAHLARPTINRFGCVEESTGRKNIINDVKLVRWVNLTMPLSSHVQDVAKQIERNQAEAKQSKVKPTTQLVFKYPPFPIQNISPVFQLVELLVQQPREKASFLGQKK